MRKLPYGKARSLEEFPQTQPVSFSAFRPVFVQFECGR